MHFDHDGLVMQEVGMLDTVTHDLKITLELSYVGVEDLLLLEDFILDHSPLLHVSLVTLITVVIEALRPSQHIVNELDTLPIGSICLTSRLLHENLVVVGLTDEEEEALASGG